MSVEQEKKKVERGLNGIGMYLLRRGYSVQYVCDLFEYLFWKNEAMDGNTGDSAE